MIYNGPERRGEDRIEREAATDRICLNIRLLKRLIAEQQMERADGCRVALIGGGHGLPPVS